MPLPQPPPLHPPTGSSATQHPPQAQPALTPQPPAPSSSGEEPHHANHHHIPAGADEHAGRQPFTGTPQFIETPRGLFHVRLYRGHADVELPLLLCCHGAGMSSMSFAAVAQLLTSVDTDDSSLSASSDPVGASGGAGVCHVVSVDLRCHGESHRQGGEGVLTLDTLVEDFVEVVQSVQKQLAPCSRLYYAGHSLGGAVVTRASTHPALASRLGGVVMLDIVEAVAKQSLQYMDAYLEKRPTSFSSPREAAHWFVTHGGMNNESLAQRTVPYLLREAEGTAGCRWSWRTDLKETRCCWPTWFDGLDKRFTTLPCPKMLLLASTDRLDKELTLAQMQGRFQLEVIGTQGHYVMEDEPAIVASKLARFVNRVETLTKKLPIFNHKSTPVGSA